MSVKTKDKILEVALRQFNSMGTDQVSIRTIAHELGISPGNLCYHFKNTEAIIFQLYLNLVEEMNSIVTIVQDPAASMQTLIEESLHTFPIMYRYKFLLIDFVTITRRIGSLRTHFRQLIALRRIQFRVGIDNMIAQGLLREEWAPHMYDQFITRSIILGDAWVSNAEVYFDAPGEEAVYFYAGVFISGMVPFLTEKGLAEFQKVVQNHPMLSVSPWSGASEERGDVLT